MSTTRDKLIMKKCSKCSVEKELSEFYKCSSRKDGISTICKPCDKARVKQFHLEHPEYRKQRHLNNIDNSNEYSRRYMSLKKDGHYSVYLLPDSNYVGITSNLYNRMSVHKSYFNRRVDNVEVLHVVNTRDEALHKEAWYHRLGFEGANPKYKIHNKLKI